MAKIGLIMLRHPPTRKSPVFIEICRLLTRWGISVDLIYPKELLTQLSQLRVTHDLYILKSGTELALSLAGALHTIGAKILNPYAVAMRMRDKIVATRILQAAGVRTPETFVTGNAGVLARLLDDGPLVVKPYRGSQGRGVHVVWTPDELNDISTHQDLIFAQRYHQPQGRDRKIYCIGGHSFGVKRVWPCRTYADKLGEPFVITPDLHEIALASGRAFGVETFGVDILISQGVPYVVDISSFPGFKGVPDAALRLADYIYTVLQRVLAGESMLPEVGQTVTDTDAAGDKVDIAPESICVVPDNLSAAAHT